MVATVVDAVIVVLLLAVLGLGVWLHHNLRRLRQHDSQINHLIDALGRATSRAETALDGLRQTVETSRTQLADELGRAQEIADDLRFLTDRGCQRADRLTEQIERTRGASRHDPRLAEPLPAPRRATKRLQTPTELEQALRTLR